METIRLLVAASESIPEGVLRRKLAQFKDFAADKIQFIENGAPIKRVAEDIWPSATPVKITNSRASYRKAIGGCTHLVFLWDGDDLSRLLFEAKLNKTKTTFLPINITKVVNKKETSDYDVYIGRGTPWGNPFAISYDDGPDRGDVIERYQELFNQKIATDEAFKKGVLAMRGLKLACFCKPSPCHGDVIANYLNAYADEPNSGADEK